MNLSIILPILNEQEGIRDSIADILSYSKYFSELEIIAVNDGSKDNTLSILEDLKKKNKRIKIVSHKTNRGYGAALRSGIKNSSYDWVFFTDADMQFDMKELLGFLPHTKNFDFIVGFREGRADPPKVKFRSWVYNRLVRMLFGLPLKDVDCAFKLMKKTAVSKIRTSSNSFFISAELMTKAHKKRLRIKEIGVKHRPRRKGKSTVTIKRVLHTILDLVKLRLSYI
ncbi:MAG: glycosyltransferase family 2 protein [Candidatus Levyibacteriota bacterium]